MFTSRTPHRLIEAQANLTAQQVKLLAAFTEKDKVQSDLMQRQNEWTLGSVDTMQKQILAMSSDGHVAATIRKVGLLPFMQNADSAVRAEIQALQEQLGITREAAIAYMRSRIPAEVPQ